MPRRVDDFRGLTQPRRMSLLREVQRVPGRGAQELAEKCGMPVNTARDHLQVLVEEGLIRSEQVQTGTRGRPPVVFHPVRERTSSAVAQRRVAESLRRGALVRKAVGATSVDAAAGQIDVLYDHLDDAGLEPVLDESTRTFELAPCNYHQLLDAEQATVCAVHARLVADVLQQVDGPLSVKRLEPFVTEHSCRLTLTDVIPLRPPSA